MAEWELECKNIGSTSVLFWERIRGEKVATIDGSLDDLWYEWTASTERDWDRPKHLDLEFKRKNQIRFEK